MPHIHTNPGAHDHTVGGFIVRLDFDKPRLILHGHLKLGLLLHFGGHVEVDETPWQAVLHELREESGYGPEQLQLLQPKERLKGLVGVDQHPIPVSHLTHEVIPEHFHTDMQYAFVVDGPPNHSPDERESTEMVLLTRDELAKFKDQRLPENIRQVGLFIFDTCLPNWERIPAADW